MKHYRIRWHKWLPDLKIPLLDPDQCRKIYRLRGDRKKVLSGTMEILIPRRNLGEKFRAWIFVLCASPSARALTLSEVMTSERRRLEALEKGRKK